MSDRQSAGKRAREKHVKRPCFNYKLARIMNPAAQVKVRTGEGPRVQCTRIYKHVGEPL
jgi:hypothetical protein